MGMRSIRLPDVGEGVAEAEIVEWSVKVGDLVREDQVIAAVMTDKATVEIPTPVAGAVVALGGAVGDVLAVGSELIRIDAPGLPELASARGQGRRRQGRARQGWTAARATAGGTPARSGGMAPQGPAERAGRPAAPARSRAAAPWRPSPAG